jgi:hypothetical protein
MQTFITILYLLLTTKTIVFHEYMNYIRKKKKDVTQKGIECFSRKKK